MRSAAAGLYAAVWVLNFVGFLRDGAFCEPWERGGGDATLVVGARCDAVRE